MEEGVGRGGRLARLLHPPDGQGDRRARMPRAPVRPPPPSFCNSLRAAPAAAPCSTATGPSSASTLPGGPTTTPASKIQVWWMEGEGELGAGSPALTPPPSPSSQTVYWRESLEVAADYIIDALDDGVRELKWPARGGRKMGERGEKEGERGERERVTARPRPSSLPLQPWAWNSTSSPFRMRSNTMACQQPRRIGSRAWWRRPRRRRLQTPPRFRAPATARFWSPASSPGRPRPLPPLCAPATSCSRSPGASWRATCARSSARCTRARMQPCR